MTERCRFCVVCQCCDASSPSICHCLECVASCHS